MQGVTPCQHLPASPLQQEASSPAKQSFPDAKHCMATQAGVRGRAFQDAQPRRDQLQRHFAQVCSGRPSAVPALPQQCPPWAMQMIAALHSSSTASGIMQSRPHAPCTHACARLALLLVAVSGAAVGVRVAPVAWATGKGGDRHPASGQVSAGSSILVLSHTPLRSSVTMYMHVHVANIIPWPNKSTSAIVALPATILPLTIHHTVSAAHGREVAHACGMWHASGGVMGIMGDRAVTGCCGHSSRIAGTSCRWLDGAAAAEGKLRRLARPCL